MDRKTFIQRLLAGGAVLGAGLTLASVFNEAQAIGVPLPALREHVRHGLLAPEQADNLWPGPKWIGQLQRDRFFADGIAASDQDLFFANLLVGDQAIGLTLQDGQVAYSQGSTRRKLDLVSDKAVLCHRQEPYRIHAVRLRQGLVIPAASLGRELLAFSFTGEARVGSQNIHQDQALYFKKPQQIKIQGDKGTLLILVSKT